MAPKSVLNIKPVKSLCYRILGNKKGRLGDLFYYFHLA